MHRDARRQTRALWQPFAVEAGQVLQLGGVAGPGLARLYRRSRRHRRAGLSRQPRDLHARQLRRPWRARAADRRRAACRRERLPPRRRDRLLAGDLQPRLTQTGRSACSTVRTARRISSPPTTSTTFFAADGRFTTTPTAPASASSARSRMGARGRRRGRPASVEHPRQRLRDRHHRLHRRHADHPRPRRAEPRRLRLPGHHRAEPSCGRSASSARATKSASAPHAGGGRAAPLRSRTPRSPRSRPVRSAGSVAREARRRRLHRRSQRAAADSAERRLPPRRRCLPARRIRPDRARPRAALPRARADAGRRAAVERRAPGIIDLTPGIRSLQIHYDSRAARLATSDRRAAVDRRRASATSSDIEVAVAHRAPAAVVGRSSDAARHRQSTCSACAPTRRGARATSSSSAASTASTRSTTCKRIVFDASYLVLGLGDVYLGAPVATPVDPRHRLVTTKYNPARTWTPENAVGIGGAYLCVYGMEGPGGYQFVRPHLPDVEHLPHHRRVRARQALAAALLRPDPVLSGLRRGAARVPRRVSRQANARSTSSRRASGSRTIVLSRCQRREDRCVQARPAGRLRRRARALAGDRVGGEWRGGGYEAGDSTTTWRCRQAATAVESPVPGSVWKILVEPGREVTAGETLVIVESMKMEIAVCAPSRRLVREVRCAEGRAVQLGQTLVIMADVAA